MGIMAILLLLAQAGTSDPLLVRLQGRWQGNGTVLATAAAVELTWEWTLDQQFLRLTFANQMGSRRFEGHAYYRPLGSGRYRGTWFDNSGMIRPIEARQDGDALIAAWGTPDTERGETTYRLLPNGEMDILDRVLSADGTWRPFGHVVLRRAGPLRSLLPAQSGLMNRYNTRINRYASGIVSRVNATVSGATDSISRKAVTTSGNVKLR